MTGVLAVDGGQSGIRARHSGSATITEVPGVSRQEGDVVAAVAAAVALAWTELGRPRAERVVLGLTTAPTDDGEIERLASQVATEIGADEVLLCDDTVIAHAGALEGGWGVALRAGTGVACLAVAEGGVPFVVDGHGYLLGDDGAAFWIGREGLRAVLRAADGRADGTDLRAAATARFGDLDHLHVRVHDSARPVHGIAAFAPDVLSAAEGGDTVAGAIVGAAAHQLALTAATATSRIPGQPRVPVALGGRLLEASVLLRSLVATSLAGREPRADVRAAASSPLDGALGLGSGAYPDRYGALVHHWRPALSGRTLR
jgi:N-acetylglucosamine kinase-like BadF-type ATPase